MNKYKIISMSAAALIVLFGCSYLWLGDVMLLPALIAAVLAVCVMGGANAAEVKASGQKGFIAYIPSICFFVLAAFLCAAVVFYLI